MSVNLDPSIDPITGLPVLNPSGPVQQIPLGQEVFPYADLNATVQPTRGPIYGDDIIPTSGLVTAPDKQMKPRSIQSTTTRELRVREAVFQNLGAAIPDGTTAPVDVNVVSGGGGGVAPAKYNNFSAPTVGTLCHNNDTVYFDEVVHASVIYGITFWAALDPNSTPVQPNVSYIVFLSAVAGGGIGMVLALGGWSIVSAGITSDLKGDSTRILFPVPIDRAKTWPTATSILISLQAEGGDIFCGGAAIVG